MLRIGFKEMNFHGVCPLYLNNNKIGDVTIGNKDGNRVSYQIVHIQIYDKLHRGNYYFPEFLKIIENKASM